MVHRHLNHQDYTLAAIDDTIARGKRIDWERLRTAVVAEPALGARVLRVCGTHAADPYAQRYHFWRLYAERRIA